MKAVKFGGTSMSTAEAVLEVKRIIESDPSRRFVVVSAHGKAAGENKVTDMLIEVAASKADVRVELFAAVRARFAKILDGIGLGGNALDAEFEKIESELPSAPYDYTVSRGEYLTAIMLAKLLDY